MTLRFISDALKYCVFVTVIYAVLRWLWVKKKDAQIDWRREILLLLFVEYMTVIVSQTIIPRWIFVSGKMFFYEIGEKLPTNLVPFKSISKFIMGFGLFDEVTVINILANILIFVPFGLFLPLLWRNLRSLWKTLAIGTIMIITIETIQYFIGRTADIDDYILNILGVAAGYGLWKLWIKQRKSQG
ncbi:MAG: VanZ family protein [Clostridiales bacterium]|jgi:glycopeptide antibiotics resistance protein|nr:VanZ family protein [Clostridiales bacterium]